MSRVLVTGGAGFIGSHLVDRLVGEGRAVTVLDNLSTGRRENLAEAEARGDVRVAVGSVLDRDAVAAAMAGCSRVFHLAVESVRRSIGRPVENHDVNATGTLLVLEEARRRRVARFVYCSSSEIYGNCGSGPLSEKTLPEPVTVYGASKLAGEHYAKAYHQTYGLPAAIVRPFNTYGPREHESGDSAEVIPRFVVRVLNGLPPVIFGTGNASRDFTYVTETAAGLALAAGCDALIGKTVNIAFGRTITIAEVARTVLRQCGRTDLAPLHIEPRPGDVHVLHADTAFAREALGFAATTPFEDGLGRYVEWFRRRHPDPSVLLEADVRNWAAQPD
jgi:UDP-glucose 4-epimerase